MSSCSFAIDVKEPVEFEEMCSRWMAVGAFWPFSRNHYSDSNTNKHEPWMVCMRRHRSARGLSLGSGLCLAHTSLPVHV
jgi:hypothetical protein